MDSSFMMNDLDQRSYERAILGRNLPSISESMPVPLPQPPRPCPPSSTRQTAMKSNTNDPRTTTQAGRGHRSGEVAAGIRSERNRVDCKKTAKGELAAGENVDAETNHGVGGDWCAQHAPE
jgi:hypothetical protein